MTRTEWQVVLKGPPHGEVHVFASQVDALHFARRNMVQVIHEGGILGSELPWMRKVVRHGKLKGGA